MRRRLAIAALVFAGLLTSLLTAAPASAGSGVGCQGAGCSITLTQLIQLKGDQGSSAGAQHTPVDVAPPPCLWEPIGDATTGSEAIIQEYGNNPPTILGVAASVTQAKALLKNPTPGNWYELPVNPAASPAGQAACMRLPLYYWAVTPAQLPVPPVPPKTLAAFAYNHMRIPVPTAEVNPANKSYVNLASYVWGHWARSPTTGQYDAYKIMAQLGQQVVTVWAQPASLSVTTVGPGQTFSDCGPHGSRYPIGHPPASAGAGTAPDCGVLWDAPDASAGVSVAVRWSVTWGVGNLNGPGGNALPPITMASLQHAVRVSEIQSINGG